MGVNTPARKSALAIQITRTRRPFARKRVSRETVYAVTDLDLRRHHRSRARRRDPRALVDRGAT